MSNSPGFYKLTCRYKAFGNPKETECEIYYGSVYRLNKETSALLLYEQKRINRKGSIARICYAKEFPQNEVKRILSNYSGHGTASDYTLENLNETPEDYGFVPFFEYTAPADIIKEQQFDRHISEKLSKRLKEKSIFSIFPIIEVGEDMEHAAVINKNYYNIYSIKPYTNMYCSKCGGSFFPAIRTGFWEDILETSCPACRNNSRGNMLRSEEYNSFMIKYYSGYNDGVKRTASQNAFLVSRYENGIAIDRITRTVSFRKGVFHEVYTVSNRVIHIPGEETKAYKCMKSGVVKECDVFDALHITSKSLESFDNVIYDGYNL